MLGGGDGNYLEIFERDAAKQTVGEANWLHLCLRCDDAAQVTEIVRRAGAQGKNRAVFARSFRQNGFGRQNRVRFGVDGRKIEFFECPQL